MTEWNDVVETIRDFEKSQTTKGAAKTVEVMAVLILSDGEYYQADVSHEGIKKHPWTIPPYCCDCRKIV